MVSRLLQSQDLFHLPCSLPHSHDAIFNKITKFNVSLPPLVLKCSTFLSCLISLQTIPRRLFIYPISTCSSHNIARRTKNLACTPLYQNCIFSRFNVHVFIPRLCFPPHLVCSSAPLPLCRWKKLYHVLFSVERIMSFLYAFYSTSHSTVLFPPHHLVRFQEIFEKP